MGSLLRFPRRKASHVPRILEWGVLVILVLVAFKVRLHAVTNPLADWHSFRQSDTASVTREYVRHGIDLLRPRYHDVSNIQSGKLNLEGWRMVEFPLLNALTAQILLWQPSWDIVVVSRLVSIISSLVSLGALVYVARQLFGRAVGFVTGFVFAVLPYNIYYSRVILPEPFMVMWALLAAAAVWEWSARLNVAMTAQARRRQIFFAADLCLLCAGVFFALALLIKPTALFFLPFYVGIAWRNRQWSLWPWIKAAVVFSAAIIPLWWWRQWIQQFPEGIPASTWLLNGNGIRLRPAWWRWLFADRLGRMMFGYWGAPFVILGAVVGVPRWMKNQKITVKSLLEWKDRWLQQEGALILGGAGMIAYLVVFATGNVQHDYYQVPLVPLLCLLFARAVVWVWNQAEDGVQKIAYGAGLSLITLFMLAFSWYEVSPLFGINNPAVEPTGEAVQRLVPEDSLIVAHYNGDTTLLFATARRGWPIGYSMEEKRADGAEYFVSTALDDETRMLLDQYTLVEQTDLYTIIDIRQAATLSAQERE